MSMKEKIEQTMKEAKPWQRVSTSVDGLFLIKAPARGDQEQIMLELNPLDDLGRPIKRRGIFLSNVDQAERFQKLMSNKKVVETLEIIQDRPKTESTLQL